MTPAEVASPKLRLRAQRRLTVDSLKDAREQLKEVRVPEQKAALERQIKYLKSKQTELQNV